MNNKTGKAALLVAVLALLSSLAGFAPAAGFIISSSKQIKPGVIVSSDIHKGGVRSTDIRNGTVGGGDIATEGVASTDIANGTVGTTDIGEGQVQPGDVTMPEPEELAEPEGGTVEVGSEYQLVDEAVTYTKEDPTSVLAVEWNGTAHAGFSGCVFQLRVNGLAGNSALSTGGDVFVAASSTWSGSTTALFDGLGTGAMKVEVWAKATIGGGSTFPCTAGPADTVPQRFVIGEEVI
jgi:hypothetical protein